MTLQKRLNRLSALLLMALLVTPCLAAEDQPAFSASDLLEPKFFPDSQFGMKVESAVDGETMAIVTTGARFLIDKRNDSIECVQRIGIERPVARIRLPKGSLDAASLAHSTSGAAIVSSEKATVRINCDSLAMISLKSGGSVSCELQFTPDFFNPFKGNFNFFDPHGGISFFEHGKCPSPTLSMAKDPVTVTYPLGAGDVLWAAVSPPKPFDWQASVRDQIIIQGSSVDRYMYPSDLSIKRWSRRFNHLYLCSELAWEHWQLSLIPRNRAEYQRVMRSAHELGMKTLVYASPKMFTKATPVESRAAHDPAAPTAGTTTGWHSGSNAKLYLEQATRLVKEFETDGFFFDEMYTGPESLATQYWLARSTRALVGDGGPMVYHSTTDALGAGHYGPVCPPLNAWFNAILKGEGEFNHIEPGYTRYVLGTYNTSNALGLQIVDERYVPTPERIDFWLRNANLRFWISELFYDTGQIEVFRHHYWPRLNAEELKRDLEPDLLKPTGLFQQQRVKTGSN